MNINATTSVNGSGGAVGQAMPAPPTIKENQVSTNQLQQDQNETALATEDTKELVQDLNELMDGLQTSIGFSIHEGDNNQVVVQIKDRRTSELIKQIPSEELLVIKEKMEEFTGLIFDRRI
jgi:flagellar protein FlaG